MPVRLRHAPLLLLAGLFTGCLPTFDTNDSLVTAPRVLAMQSTPAEAAPGTTIEWTALYATPGGSVTSAPVQWDLCIVQTPLTTIGPVSTACLDATSGSVQTVGQGESVSGALPADACRQFGPDGPAAMPGQPAGRPVDPDPTGGYYQPIIMLTDVATLGETRLSCGLAQATQQEAATFTEEYHPNQNPVIDALLLGAETVPPAGAGQPFSVKVGSKNPLAVTWPTCPATPTECQGAETFVVFDESSQQIVQQRESIRVTWFTTGGSFAQATGGVAGDDPATQVTNDWTAPATPGTVTLWVVLVDDRGGTGWESYTVDVTE